MGYRQQLDQDLAFYRSQHRTAGCKLTHMLGVPMILYSLFTLPVNPRRAGKLQLAGWILQLLGHAGFEHNTPVILEIRRPTLFVAAVVFVAQEWKSLLTEGRL